MQSGLSTSLSGAGTSGTSGTSNTTTSSGGSRAATAAGVQKYSQCITKAGGDVTKMQKCASLLNGG